MGSDAHYSSLCLPDLYITMKHSLQNTVSTFLKERCDFSKPVLLALSGGPDSMALLHAVLNCNLPVKLAAGHVDHGWRQESRQEASHLQNLAQDLDLPFYLKVLNPDELKGNKEESARKERLKFFSDLCSEHGYQAVMLAHHRNDQAETVLKRLLEGSGLFNARGMTPAAVHSEYGLTLWRPFLDIPKSVLLEWLDIKRHSFFTDATNFDTKFLRSRMRLDMLPNLKKSFGKEIEQNLCCIGKDSQEIHALLSKNLQPLLDSIEISKAGSFLDLSKTCPSTSLEVKFLINRLCQDYSCRPSRSLLESVAEHILSGAGNKLFYVGDQELFIDRKRIFIRIQNDLDLQNKRVKLEHQTQWGPWQIELEHLNVKQAIKSTNWHSIWNGEGEGLLPAGEYELGKPEMNALYPRTSQISKWWNNHKIPAFLRAETPVIWQGNRIIHEFLTGRSNFEGKSLLKVRIQK